MKVIVTPVFSGPVGDPSAHFALAVVNPDRDIVYTYDSLEESAIPEKIIQCVQNASGSSATRGVAFGEEEKQRGAWECAYLVLRRQFVTFLVILSILEGFEFGEFFKEHPFHVTNEWVDEVLMVFHENVALEWVQAGYDSQATAIHRFVNCTLLPVWYTSNRNITV